MNKDDGEGFQLQQCHVKNDEIGNAVWCSARQRNCLRFIAEVFGMHLWALLPAFVGGAALFHVLIVLFGAHCWQAVTATFTLACLLSALCVVPCAALHGLSMHAALEVLVAGAGKRPLDTICQATCWGALCGCWLGAAGIPLDWEVSWQKWPWPCGAGAGAGALLGLIVGLVTRQHTKAGLPGAGHGGTWPPPCRDSGTTGCR